MSPIKYGLLLTLCAISVWVSGLPTSLECIKQQNISMEEYREIIIACLLDLAGKM
ncbi:hypothetical protein C0J52_17451 [Blattella germanica]|nr:hypothetical protein C0J52_17451 [Blattella germanica]